MGLHAEHQHRALPCKHKVHDKAGEDKHDKPIGPSSDFSFHPQVRALVRKRENTVADAIPPAVEVVPGDIGDVAACRAAVEGVDKVRCPGYVLFRVYGGQLDPDQQMQKCHVRRAVNRVATWPALPHFKHYN